MKSLELQRIPTEAITTSSKSWCNELYNYRSVCDWFHSGCFLMPARIVPKNYRNLTGFVYNFRTSTITAFESSLERDFLLLLDFDPNVECFEEQPIKILYQDDTSRLHTYTPDVLFRFPPHTQGASGPT